MDEPIEDLRLVDGLADGSSSLGAREEVVAVLVADLFDCGPSSSVEDVAEDLGVVSEVAEDRGDPARVFGAGDTPVSPTACWPPHTLPLQRLRRELLRGKDRGGLWMKDL